MRSKFSNQVTRSFAIAGFAAMFLTSPASAIGTGGTPDPCGGGCGTGGNNSSDGATHTPDTRTCGFVSHPDGQGGYRIFAIAEGYYSGQPNGRRMHNIAELEIRGTDTNRTYDSRNDFEGVRKGEQPIIDADAFINNGTLNDRLYETWAEGQRGGSRDLAQCAQDALNEWIAENGDAACLTAVIVSRGKHADVKLKYTPTSQ